MNACRTAILVAVSGAAWLAPAVEAQAPRSPVQVVLHNDGVAPPEVASRAQAEVTRLYALINVDVVWVSATTDEASLRIVKLTTWDPGADRIPDTALGTTFRPDTAEPRAYVFWPRVQRYAQQYIVGIEILLGAAIAHELGHILLPPGSHASHGLMRGTWDREQFRSVASGRLHFSPQSAAQIRRSINNALASRKPARRVPCALEGQC